jgi:hypothetical protein
MIDWDRVLHDGRRARLAGVLYLLGGILVGALAAHFLLRAPAARGDRFLLIPSGALALPLSFVATGLVLLVAGGRAHLYLISQNGQPMTGLQKRTYFLMVAASVPLAFVLIHLMAPGYR